MLRKHDERYGKLIANLLGYARKIIKALYSIGQIYKLRNGLLKSEGQCMQQHESVKVKFGCSELSKNTQNAKRLLPELQSMDH